MVQSNNHYPHIVSRGGYEWLEEKIMEEKEQQYRQACQSDPSAVVHPPSPPERHVKWKRARVKASGEYTSDEARVVAEKIDTLVEQASQGTFVSQGRNDILAVAIGKPEHPGRVRGVGQGLGIRDYFGRHSRCAPSLEVVTRDELPILTENLTQKIRQDLLQELASMGFSIQNTTSKHSPSIGVANACSGKGSCSSPEQISEENLFGDVPVRYKLYVDNPLRIVAIGSVVNLGPTIHNKKLENDMARVVVEEVQDASAKVPMPTDEVQIVGQALKSFIQWPRRLMKPFSTKNVAKDVQPKMQEPQLSSVQELMILIISVQDPIKLKLEHDAKLDAFCLTPSEIMDLCTGNQKLSLSVIQLWLTYLHGQCTLRGNSHLYGFIDPQHMLKSHAKGINHLAGTIGKILFDGKKECYLAPYMDLDQYQLFIICPKSNEVVFISSLPKKPNENIKNMINTAVISCNIMRGQRNVKPTWHFPSSRKQSGTTESGFYIMRHMLNIVFASITDLWMERFHTIEPFPKEDLYDIQKRWSRHFLDLYPTRII